MLLSFKFLVEKQKWRLLNRYDFGSFFKQEMIGFSLNMLKSRYKGHILNLINILLCGSQWLNPCVKYQKLISHKTLNCQLFVISMEIEDFIID